MPLDYNRLHQEKLAANVREVRDQFAQNRLPRPLRTKVDRFAAKFGVSSGEVVRAAVSEPLFAATFATDPVKQSLHEKAAATYISSMRRLVTEFTNLPSRGPGSLYVSPRGDLSRTRPAGSGTSSTLWVDGSTPSPVPVASLLTRSDC